MRYFIVKYLVLINVKLFVKYILKMVKKFWYFGEEKVMKMKIKSCMNFLNLYMDKRMKIINFK